MPNLITRYTNGTFEGDKTTWNSQLNESAFASITRSNDFAYEGTYSAKFVLKALGLGVPWGFNSLLSEFISNTDAHEATIRVRATAPIPDDYYFIMTAFVNTTKERIIKYCRADECKVDWGELTTNYFPLTYASGPNQVTPILFYIVKDMPKLLLSQPDLLTYYPELDDIEASSAAWPTGAAFYLDAMTAEEKAMPVIVDNDPALGRKLYHVENVFLLSDGTNVYSIDEPIGWDKILLNIDFDMSMFKYKFEFTDKDVVLQFDRSCGYDILKNLWDTLGPTATASLKFGEKDSAGVLTIHWEGDLIFADGYSDNKYKVFMSAEKRSLSETFRTRFDTQVDLIKRGRETSPATFDGLPVTPIGTTDLWLLPTMQLLNVEFIANPNAGKIGDIAFVGIDVHTAIPLLQMKVGGIDGLQDPLSPDGNFYYSGSTFKNGILEKIVNVNMAKVSYTFTHNGGGLFAGMRIYKISNISALTGDIFAPPPAANVCYQYQQVISNVPGTTTINASLVSSTFVLKPDEALFIEVYVLSTPGSGFAISSSQWVSLPAWTMLVESRETQQSGLVKSYKIFDALKYQLKIITGINEPLKSNFFFDGCGSKNVLLNGLMIRSIFKSFSFSAKDWVNSLSAIYCLGLSAEKNADGSLEWIRVEPIQYFFKNIETLKLSFVANYKREAAMDFIYNELEFGFSKGANSNEANSLSDWMNRKSYIIPAFKLIKQKLSKVSDFILSHLVISLTRAQNIANNYSGNYETDKNTFMIGYSGTEISNVFYNTNIQFFAATSKILVSRFDIPVVVGDAITIGSTANNNGVKHVTEVLADIGNDRVTITVTETLIDETSTFTDISFSSRLIPNMDEQFSDIDGIDPIVDRWPYYNLRHHVKRVFYRWSKVFATAFIPKDDLSFKVKFSSGENNNDVGTALKDDADCVSMDGGSGTQFIRDNSDDIFLDDPAFPLDKPLFGKNIISFETPMSWTSFNAFRKAFEGRHPDGKNYGFISWPNPDGDIERGFCLSGKFDPIRQMCKFRTIEKYSNA